MTFAEFEHSLKNRTPQENLNLHLKVLWYDANGNWDKAHDIAQDILTQDGSLLHAYLHRVEGDDWNAGYWYKLAAEPNFSGSLKDEWLYLVNKFL